MDLGFVLYHVTCVFSLYTLLKVVSRYDLSGMSMSVMVFQKSLDRGVGGCGEFYTGFYFYFWNCFNFAKPLTHNRHGAK